MILYLYQRNRIAVAAFWVDISGIIICNDIAIRISVVISQLRAKSLQLMAKISQEAIINFDKVWQFVLIYNDQ